MPTDTPTPTPKRRSVVDRVERLRRAIDERPNDAGPVLRRVAPFLSRRQSRRVGGEWRPYVDVVAFIGRAAATPTAERKALESVCDAAGIARTDAALTAWEDFVTVEGAKRAFRSAIAKTSQDERR